jgi:hypothetical protein
MKTFGDLPVARIRHQHQLTGLMSAEFPGQAHIPASSGVIIDSLNNTGLTYSPLTSRPVQYRMDLRLLVRVY